jgi:hypothetical protein
MASVVSLQSIWGEGMFSMSIVDVVNVVDVVDDDDDDDDDYLDIVCGHNGFVVFECVGHSDSERTQVK